MCGDSNPSILTVIVSVGKSSLSLSSTAVMLKQARVVLESK